MVGCSAWVRFSPDSAGGGLIPAAPLNIPTQTPTPTYPPQAHPVHDRPNQLLQLPKFLQPNNNLPTHWKTKENQWIPPFSETCNGEGRPGTHDLCHQVSALAPHFYAYAMHSSVHLLEKCHNSLWSCRYSPSAYYATVQQPTSIQNIFLYSLWIRFHLSRLKKNYQACVRPLLNDTIHYE